MRIYIRLNKSVQNSSAADLLYMWKDWIHLDLSVLSDKPEHSIALIFQMVIPSQNKSELTQGTYIGHIHNWKSILKKGV